MARAPKTIPLALLEAEIAVWVMAIPAATFDLRSQGHREAFTHVLTYLENYRRLRYRKVARDERDPAAPETDTPAAPRSTRGAPG